MNKIHNLQALRGIAVLGVLLFHLSAIEQKYGGRVHLFPDIVQFGMSGVDLFFVISGFVMVTVTRGQFQTPKLAFRFLYHRIARIYPTYWVYTSLVFIVFLLKPSWVNRLQGHQVDVVASFLLLPAETLPLVIVGWTLIHELYFYLVFFLILLVIAERRLVAALLVWGIAVVLLNILSEASSPVIAVTTHPLTLEFIGGCFLAIRYHEKSVRTNDRVLRILAAGALISSLFAYHAYEKMTGLVLPADGWRVILFGLPSLLIVFCLTHLERQGCVAHPFLVRIGDASYSIYLSHVLVMSAAGRVWQTFASDGVWDNLIMTPILFILAVSGGMIGYLYLEKPLLKVSRKLVR